MGSHGPIGTRQEIFQTNFAFGRAVRLWRRTFTPATGRGASRLDGLSPRSDHALQRGQMNRLRIRGEYHVKSGEVLEPDAVPPLSAPLAHTMLASKSQR